MSSVDGVRAERMVTIVNQRGLHARAAAKFVNLVGEFSAAVDVTKDGETVSGRSIMGLMMLAASTGCSIHISTHGADADEALTAIVRLIEGKFDED